MPTNLSSFLGSSFTGNTGAQGAQGASGSAGIGVSIITTTGISTFTVGVHCPSAITRIKITACGGGGNGGTGGNGNAGGYGGGAGGGGAAASNTFYRSVTNGDSYTFVVGTNAGVTTIRYPGSTVFATCPAGGNGGNGGFQSDGAPAGAGGAAGTLSPLAVQNYNVGRIGDAGKTDGTSGNGAINSFFANIFGTKNTIAAGSNPSPGFAAGTVGTSAGPLNMYGSGGGGGGAGYGDGASPFGGGAGGSGAPGAVVIEY